MHISTTRGRQILHAGRKMTDSLNLLQSVDGRGIRRDPLVPEGNSGAEGNDRSALCWTLPELSIHFDQTCKVASPARITHTFLSSGRLRHSFDLKCNWYQRSFHQNPTKNTRCASDALEFWFLGDVSAVWTEIFITFCLLHLQPLTVDSCGPSFFYVFFFFA